MKQLPLRKYSLIFLTTGLAVATAIKESLSSHDVDISKARGQAYDGASAMSSDRCGVQAQIRKSAPMAIIYTLSESCSQSEHCSKLQTP